MPENHNQFRHTLTVMEGREKNRQMVEDFADEAKKRGWNFCQLLKINSDQIARLDFGNIPFDFVIFRELSRNNYFETERVMEWLQKNHTIGINLNVVGKRIATSDKHFQQGLFQMDPILKQYALPTFEAKTKANVLAYVKQNRVHYPLVLKHRRGTAGNDITLIRSATDLDKIVTFSNLLIEQYIEPECDWRVFVIGGTPVGTMRKIGDKNHPEDFKKWSGGYQKYLEQDPDVLDLLGLIATRAAAISKLEYAGVDIIKEQKTGKYFILETNIAAGWPNFIPVTHINIPSLVLDWLEDVSNGRKQPIELAIRSYLKKRLQYLPERIQQDYQAILDGVPDITKRYKEVFANYPDQFLYDAGRIFCVLDHAYQDIIKHPENTSKYLSLAQEIDKMPLSWAGNYIGPEVGTLHDGAILTALYLFLLHKTTEI